MRSGCYDFSSTRVEGNDQTILLYYTSVYTITIIYCILSDHSYFPYEVKDTHYSDTITLLNVFFSCMFMLKTLMIYESKSKKVVYKTYFFLLNSEYGMFLFYSYCIIRL